MGKHSMICAGIDTGKDKLDVAIAGSALQLRVDNSESGHAALLAWLRQQRVQRVGIEATGGYEAAMVTALRRAGLPVIVLQPAQVRAYAVFRRQRAKTDRIDAGLIADCARASEAAPAPPDPRLAALAGALTLIEQLTEDIARFKTRREACHGEVRLAQFWSDEIAHLKSRQRAELAALVERIRAHRDLAERLDLIVSVAGVGPRTAVAILVRLPEIGRLSREQAAALAGLAPDPDDSGDHAGPRHVAGGRERLRGALYAAALPAAFRWNPQLIALYQRLTGRGKPHKVALVACARKLLIYVNTVVARGQPWTAAPRPALT